MLHIIYYRLKNHSTSVLCFCFWLVINLKKRRCLRLKSNIKYVIVIITLLSLITLVLFADRRMRIIIGSYAQSRARIIANSIISSTVNDYLSGSSITYKDLMLINCGIDGTVNSVEFDTITITKIKSSIIAQIQNNIARQENVVVSVPIGTLTGSQFLNNRGPKIDISFNMSSAVYSKISSTFTSAGINQTLHKISLDICADMYFVMPWYRTSGSFETEFVLAETIIVGDVPDAYTNVIEYPGSDMAGLLFDYGA